LATLILFFQTILAVIFCFFWLECPRWSSHNAIS